MKVLLIDDHPLFREGLARLLTALPFSIHIDSVNCAQDALEMMETEEFDYLFLDLQLPDVDGIQFLHEMKRRKWLTPVVILSANEEIETINYCLKNGACCYLPKSASGSEISTALTMLETSGFFIPEKIQCALDNLNHEQTEKNAHCIRLTSRQRQVVQYMADGFSNQQIADQLGLSLSTVKGHVSTLFDLFCVDNRTQCITRAKEYELIL